MAVEPTRPRSSRVEEPGQTEEPGQPEEPGQTEGQGEVGAGPVELP